MSSTHKQVLNVSDYIRNKYFIYIHLFLFVIFIFIEHKYTISFNIIFLEHMLLTVRMLC